MLRDYGLNYLVEDEVIQITTPEDADSRLHVRVYDCRELLDLPETKTGPLRQAVERSAGSFGPGLPPSAAGPATPQAPPAPQQRDLPGDLVGVIMSTVTPDSWDDVGGPGNAKEYKGMLAVLQTSENHEKVEKLLNLMHSAANLETKVKVSR